MSVKHPHNRHALRKGFLLPDVMLAVFVVSAAFVSILAVMVPVIRLELFKRDEIIARGLAQEGLELVRNWRDAEGVLDANGHQRNFSEFAGNMIVNCPRMMILPGMFSCRETDDQVLFFKYDANGMYRFGGQTSKFRRAVTAKEIIPNKAYEISSRVFWGSSPKHEVIIKTVMYDWSP